MIRYLIEIIYHYSTYLTSWSWQKLYGDRTKRGTVTMHALYILCSRKSRENLDFLKSLLKYNVMTLDRKKEKIQEFVTWVDTQKEKPILESRV